MLEKITNTFSNIVRTVSGKSTITEKNIEDTVEQIKMALLEADLTLRSSFSTALSARPIPREIYLCHSP